MTRDLQRAEKMFETFNGFDPTDVGEFHQSFSIPREAYYRGTAKTMFYSSDKLNPISGEDEGMIQYFHDPKVGVRLYTMSEHDDLDVRNIPKWIHGVNALVRLGDCDGFEYEDFTGKLIKASATKRKPEWYCIPSGKALLAVQDKRDVLAIVWGGTLSVEWRGVVG